MLNLFYNFVVLKDLHPILSDSVIPELKAQVERVRELHQQELDSGFGDVYMPAALARKYKKASKELQWQYVFPARKRSIDPRSGSERKHHVMESGLQKAVKRAVSIFEYCKN